MARHSRNCYEISAGNRTSCRASAGPSRPRRRSSTTDSLSRSSIARRRHPAIFKARDRKLADARERRARLRQAQHNRQCQPTVTDPPPTVRPPIDFAAVKATVTIAAVLQLLGASLHGCGAPQRGPCPLHGSTSGTSRCFSAHLDQNAFHCFKCGRSGNALDLWAAATRQAPYDAAVDLCARLAIPLPILGNKRNREEEPVAPSTYNSTMPST